MWLKLETLEKYQCVASLPGQGREPMHQPPRDESETKRSVTIRRKKRNIAAS
jgi:hypothetical protein